MDIGAQDEMVQSGGDHTRGTFDPKINSLNPDHTLGTFYGDVKSHSRMFFVSTPDPTRSSYLAER